MTSGVMRGVRRWCLSFPLLLILLTRLIFSPVFHTVLVFSSCSLSSSFLLSFTVFVYSSYCLSLFFSFTLSLFSPLLFYSLFIFFFSLPPLLLTASVVSSSYPSPFSLSWTLSSLSARLMRHAFSSLHTVLVFSPYPSPFLLFFTLSLLSPLLIHLSFSFSP